MFRTLVEEADAIERAAVEFSAKMHLNKAQLMIWVAQASAHPELPPLLALPNVPYILTVMPEAAFCYVASVTECNFHQKTRKCKCSKTMKFGGSTAVCIEITKRSNASKCTEDWTELSKECVVSSLVPCNDPPVDALAPRHDCAELESYYKNKLEVALAQMISTLTGKTLNQVIEIMEKNGTPALCDLT